MGSGGKGWQRLLVVASVGAGGVTASAAGPSWWWPAIVGTALSLIFAAGSKAAEVRDSWTSSNRLSDRAVEDRRVGSGLVERIDTILRRLDNPRLPVKSQRVLLAELIALEALRRGIDEPTAG